VPTFPKSLGFDPVICDQLEEKRLLEFTESVDDEGVFGRGRFETKRSFDEFHKLFFDSFSKQGMSAKEVQESRAPVNRDPGLAFSR
jgi:hypothetical protein